MNANDPIPTVSLSAAIEQLDLGLGNNSRDAAALMVIPAPLDACKRPHRDLSESTAYIARAALVSAALERLDRSLDENNRTAAALVTTREHLDGYAVARLSRALEAGTIRRPRATRVFHSPVAGQC